MQGSFTPPAEHVCGHVCPEAGCGKCTDATCTDPVCAEKCPGHEPAEHVCGHVCETCGKCTDATCTDPVCADKCPGHEPSLISGWFVETTLAEKQADGNDHLISVKLTNKIDAAANVASATVSFPADAAHAYVAVKYSGTATFKGIGLWGTKGGTASAKNGLSAGDVGGWNQQDTSAIGLDFSVLVIKIDGYYAAGEWDIDTVTNLGFSVFGNADDTFIIHGIEVSDNKNHSFGTPQPLPVEGELEIGDLTAAAFFTVTKADDGKQTVTFSGEPGWNTVEAQIKNYTSEYKYLYLDFTMNDDMSIGVYADGAPLRGHSTITKDTTKLVIDISSQTLNQSFALKFYYNATANPGDSAITTKTMVFNQISFSKTDPMASSEPNHFRTPVGNAGVVYSATDKKVTYTNTADAYYRYLEILLDNHDTAYDVLSIKVTGYDGLVLGVRMLYNDEVAGTVTPNNKDLISSDAYYSEIETAEQTEVLLYLEAYDLKGVEVTGVQLYLDAPAGAGTVGPVEITLDSIEMLKSTELNPAAVTITASDATITAGEEPNFNLSGAPAEGKLVWEYRAKDSTGNYTAGLPTAAGVYEVRFYYMGSRTHSYSRSTTATLTINDAA